MSVLVIGLSHKSAPLRLLERVAVSGDTLRKLLHDVFRLPDVAGTFIVSTCNRVEVYAEVARFHAAVTAISELLSRYSGVPTSHLTPHLYVHYEERAVKHLLSVACGLDSMVVGEGQILGQVRRALRLAREDQTLGRPLSDLGTLALRTGKRAHAETGIDRLGASLVTVGLHVAADRLREGGDSPAAGAPPATPEGLAGRSPLAGRHVLIVGAGSMSALAAATASRQGAAGIVVANRTRRRAAAVAASVGGRAADLADLPGAIAAADLVISCTGAAGLVISHADVVAALTIRAGTPTTASPAGGPEPTRPPRPLVLLDLAMPHDVERSVGALPAVRLIGIEDLSGARWTAAGTSGDSSDEVAAVQAIVEEEFTAYRTAARAAKVTPTVVALRAKAAEVVDAELARLAGRLRTVHGLDGRALDEIARTVHRVVDKLLHAPTVRVKELAASPDGDAYDAALRVLFDLDPRTVEAVAHAEPADGMRPARAGDRGPLRAASTGHDDPSDGDRGAAAPALDGPRPAPSRTVTEEDAQ